MNVREYRAALRFIETCEDGEGYDVPKPMMKRLAELGLVVHKGGGWYEGTRSLDKLQDEVSKTVCPCCNGDGYLSPADLTTRCSECNGSGYAILMLGTHQLLSDAVLDEKILDGELKIL